MLPTGPAGALSRRQEGQAAVSSSACFAAATAVPSRSRSSTATPAIRRHSIRSWTKSASAMPRTSGDGRRPRHAHLGATRDRLSRRRRSGLDFGVAHDRDRLTVRCNRAFSSRCSTAASQVEPAQPGFPGRTADRLMEPLLAAERSRKRESQRRPMAKDLDAIVEGHQAIQGHVFQDKARIPPNTHR